MGDKSENNAPGAELSQADVLRMTTEVVSAYVGNNTLPPAKIPEVINSVFGTLRTLDSGSVHMNGDRPKPAVPIRKSITPDFLVCLEDGKKLKMLKHHLQHDARGIPDEMGPGSGLPHGCTELFRAALQLRQAHRPWPRQKRQRAPHPLTPRPAATGASLRHSARRDAAVSPSSP